MTIFASLSRRFLPSFHMFCQTFGLPLKKEPGNAPPPERSCCVTVDVCSLLFLFTRAPSNSDGVIRLLPRSPFRSPRRRRLLLLFFPCPPLPSPAPVLNTGQSRHMLAGVSKPADGRLFSFPAAPSRPISLPSESHRPPSFSLSLSLALCPLPLPHSHAPPYLAEFQNTSRHVRVVSVATGQEELRVVRGRGGSGGGGEGKERVTCV